MLCHEIGHWAHWHSIVNLFISSAHIFALFWSYGTLIATYGTQVTRDFGFNTTAQVPFIVGLFLFQQLYVPVDEVISLAVTFLSRRNEFQADAYAVKAGRAKELAAALQKIQAENLGEMDPDWLYSAVKFSHPPMVERLKAIEMRQAEKDYVLVDKKKK